MHTFPDEVGQGDSLPLCFRSPTVNRYPFYGLFSAISPPLLCFLLAILLLFKMVPKGSAERLPRVPRCRKAAMGLTEKTRVLGKLCSGVSAGLLAGSSVLIS